MTMIICCTQHAKCGCNSVSVEVQVDCHILAFRICGFSYLQLALAPPKFGKLKKQFISLKMCAK